MKMMRNVFSIVQIMLKMIHIPEKVYDTLGFQKDEVSGVVYDHNDGI